jgi:hypothetical protein
MTSLMPRAGTPVVAGPSVPFLVLPRGADILALARTWYGGASWERSPGDVAAAVVTGGGARFRGAALESASEPATLAVTDGLRLEGPLPGTRVPASVLAVAAPLGPADVYRLVTGPAGEGTAGGDPGAQGAVDGVGWATAAARRARGVLLVGTSVVAPDPHEALARTTLYSPTHAGPDEIARIVRPVLSAARLVWQGEGSGLDVPFALRHDLEYDGGIVVQAVRAGADMPPALRSADWRDVGPHTVTVGWVAPGEAGGRTLASVDLIALRRSAPWMVRATRALRDALGGILLDADGFVVDDAALAAFASSAR